MEASVYHCGKCVLQQTREYGITESFVVSEVGEPYYDTNTVINPTIPTGRGNMFEIAGFQNNLVSTKMVKRRGISLTSK